MTDQNDENEIKKRKDGETEGKGSAGKGRVGGSSGGAATDSSNAARFSIDPATSKQIWAEWKQLNMSEAIAAVAEFFGEGIARASANMIVTFDSSTKAGFAIMTKFISFGQDMAGAMRARTREATAVIRRKYGINIKTKKGGQTVIAPNPGVT